MLELEKVLNLQIHYNKLESSEKDLNKLENDQEIFKLERTYLSDKNNLEKVMLAYKENEKEIKTSTRELEDYGGKLKKTETTLYNGEITDLKQLEHLAKEKTYLKEEIDNLENKTLELLEKNDKLEKSINDWKNEIANKEKAIMDLEKSTKKSLISIKKEIEKQKLFIEESSKDIKPDLLDQYLYIKEKKNSSGIASVINDVCSECNIMIRPAQVDRIKLGKEIFTCENCGRLLVFSQSKEE